MVRPTPVGREVIEFEVWWRIAIAKPTISGLWYNGSLPQLHVRRDPVTSHSGRKPQENRAADSFHSQQRPPNAPSRRICQRDKPRESIENLIADTRRLAYLELRWELDEANSSTS
jgi:hypothetical protein